MVMCVNIIKFEHRNVFLSVMVMSTNGSWVDDNCTGFLFNPERHGYVCEYNKI